MKIKALLATLVGALAIQGANAGTEWVPAPSGKSTTCTVADHCDKACDIGGSISFGYDTDYVWKGLRWAGDSIWADVNYTFDNLPFSPNIGVWHLSSLGSLGDASDPTDFGTDNYGDETNFYASINLPSVLGFDTTLGYVFSLFPNQRSNFNSAGQPINGDSFSRVQFGASRDLFAGLSFNYLAEYFFGGGLDSGWFHTAGLATSIPIFKCTSLDLSGEVTYNDDVLGDRSGFHNYLLKAALPVALNNRATLTPYIAYNGTPDGWSADGVDTGFFGNRVDPNFNDVFFGGVSIGVNF